jgi:hypothetical protein
MEKPFSKRVPNSIIAEVQPEDTAVTVFGRPLFCGSGAHFVLGVNAMMLTTVLLRLYQYPPLQHEINC